MEESLEISEMTMKTTSIWVCWRQCREGSMKKEYIMKVKKVLTSNFNGVNDIKAINSWAVSLLQYSGDVIKWTRTELANLDCKTRKLLTMHEDLHPLSNLSWLTT